MRAAARRLPRCPRARRLRGLPISACWMSASSLCASSTSRVPSSKRRRERSSIDSISTSRPERLSSAMLSFAPRPVVTGPPGPWRRRCSPPAPRGSAVSRRPCRRCACPGPRRSSGCRPARRRVRPGRAGWSRAALRGAGPPNRASIACCCASPADRPGGSGDRRREAEVGRDDQRRVARDREFVRRVALARERGAAARRDGRDEQQGGEGFTHVRWSPWGSGPSR